jgi:hypothetical protein
VKGNKSKQVEICQDMPAEQPLKGDSTKKKKLNGDFAKKHGDVWSSHILNRMNHHKHTILEERVRMKKT